MQMNICDTLKMRCQYSLLIVAAFALAVTQQAPDWNLPSTGRVTVTSRDVIECFNEHVMYKKTRVEQLLQNITLLYDEAIQELQNFRNSQCSANTFLGGSSQPMRFRVIYNATARENALAMAMLIFPESQTLSQRREEPCTRCERSYMADHSDQKIRELLRKLTGYELHIYDLKRCMQKAQNLSLSCEDQLKRYNYVPLTGN